MAALIFLFLNPGCLALQAQVMRVRQAEEEEDEVDEALLGLGRKIVHLTSNRPPMCN